jgi:hypothetical protein
MLHWLRVLVVNAEGSLRIGMAQLGGGMDKRSAYALERRGLITIERNRWHERTAHITQHGYEIAATHSIYAPGTMPIHG